MIRPDRAPAVAYLCTDLCGAAERFVVGSLDRLAMRLGYELCETIRVDSGQPFRLMLLEDRIRLHRAEAVFVPSAEHLDGQLDRIVEQADVIERDSRTHARWSSIAEIMGDGILTRHHRAEP